MSNAAAALFALACVGLVFGSVELLNMLARQPRWVGMLFFAVFTFLATFIFLKGTTK